MKPTPATSDAFHHDLQGDEIDLGNLARTLWRGKLWILLSGLLALILGVYYAYVAAVPVYTANSSVALESRQEQVMDIQSVVTGLGGDQSTINTETEVIRSRGLVEQLVLDMNLLEDPEFNARLRPPQKFSLSRAIKTVTGFFNDAPTEVDQASERAILDSTISATLEAISVTNLRQSFIFKITVVTQDPSKSAAIANRLAELYINNQIAVKFEKTEQATVWLSERVTSLQKQLETSQTALKDFSSNTKLVSSEALAGLNRQIKDLRDRRVEVSAQTDMARANLEVLRANLGSNPDAFAAAAQDPTLNQALKALRDGSAGAQEAFEARSQSLISRAELTLARAETQLEALDASIEEAGNRIETQSQELVKLEQLQREAEANRLLYDAFLSRLKETSIQQGIQQADSRILSRAVVPNQPSAPRKSRILALSLVLGVMIGAGVVLGHEMTQNTFRNAEDLEAKTGYAVIGQIPKIPVGARRDILDYLVEKPNSAGAESIRNLRTSILLANLDNPPKVIMSTSSIPGEGKTTQSVALAQNLSGMGAKVLLLEGDLRRRVLSTYFNNPNLPGFLSVISGEIPLEDAIFHDKTLNADVLFGQKSRINAADLFSSSTFTDFIAELRSIYDYIIIDTPPVLAVPDARVIGQSVDTIVYSVKWDSTSHSQVLEGLRLLESVNLKVSGLALSQIDNRKMKRYGYGYNYGNYKGYYDS
ncbi:GumC family protein [Pseudosulfitobacter pseudonitzschiae]|uniref:GumC family protein n=1 Tax=Pseudosulfitobacter pseudonitzschiae TaxID=1402135 RepID=UPI001AF8585F|nr:polysaccharide biosynthesis tyrosine autokinase [Pseudosulfitobacter pseudonitzschiae]MBM1817365.1 polysaccharide biosynthesis tyrosine autokinase [Pseudosulfitobacter pseudonitzschiae]MBM1834563.1 polysaccharide biosynthesis tyrosine autokinase [Pseudosulfitobacter pseudonitzschiae]MBM1839428.1 polysaccharide biosynthesis tyrosine autokinase [Pseudosulfitobacter pseudonitzschiae]MBM1844278.1 polysaccharide biosynthesis tyrosine autokinase [Pseudosulfitobacter pseudonitzschiae]MBM1849113.1 